MYIGGILGFGDHVGLYFTTGPMIGKNPDWAIGGGIHFAKAFGLGVVIPIRQAFNSYRKHEDKISMTINHYSHHFSDLMTSSTNYLVDHSVAVLSGLENIANTVHLLN